MPVLTPVLTSPACFAAAQQQACDYEPWGLGGVMCQLRLKSRTIGVRLDLCAGVIELWCADEEETQLALDWLDDQGVPVWAVYVDGPPDSPRFLA